MSSPASLSHSPPASSWSMVNSPSIVGADGAQLDQTPAALSAAPEEDAAHSSNEAPALEPASSTTTAKTQQGGPPTTRKATAVDCQAMKLDAFVLNQKIFNEHFFIAPLSRPDNSSFLPGVFSKSDAIPHVELDAAFPWHTNSRIADITKPTDPKGPHDDVLRKERLGVYLTWCLPRRFRTGQANDVPDVESQGIEHGTVPDRWIIYRFISEARVDGVAEPHPPALTPFIVESNRLRHFGGRDDPSVGETFDVETEASPFIDKSLPVERQVDVFMGMKRSFDDTWTEPDPVGQYHKKLTLLDSANPLFADFQHHNSNVFSIHDDLSWNEPDGNGGQKRVVPSSATVSYAVFGYFSDPTEARTICYGSLYDVEWNKNDRPRVMAAEAIAQTIHDKQPIALGMDTLEALETFLHSMPATYDWPGLIHEMKATISQAGRGGLLDAHVPQTLRAGFKPVDGGRCWRFNDENADPDDKHKQHIPNPSEMTQLLRLDRTQAYIDALERQEKFLRHILFCEWWKCRSSTPGGRGDNASGKNESRRRAATGLEALQRVKRLRLEFNNEKLNAPTGMHLTAKPEFFSRSAPSIVIGGLGEAWPSEFLAEKAAVATPLSELQFKGTNGAGIVQDWLKSLIGNVTTEICTMHGMKLFFQSKQSTDIMLDQFKNDKNLKRLPELFNTLDSLDALQYSAPGWVRMAIDSLVQEWVYLMNNKGANITSTQKDETYWNETQPCRALFLEWELEYYHLPKRFWTLQRDSDGTADYKIAPGVNISSYDGMDHYKRTIDGRSILRPNAEWVITTLLQQLLDKVDQDRVKNTDGLNDVGSKENIIKTLRDALQKLNLTVGSLEGFTDHLLTLHQGIHVSPDELRIKFESDLEKDLHEALLESKEGFDVTPYGEDLYSLEKGDRDFKPVTHGQARFTKFNIVDKFGQVISPLLRPGQGRPHNLYPCLGRSLACQPNDSEGGEFANSVDLDDEHCSQFFQLGHRINQDARLNTYFAVNSSEFESFHMSTQFFKGDRNLQRGQIEHEWRPATEYEDPVWGWLMLDFRNQGIQVYNAAGENMGEALLPNSIHDKVHWQVYYPEGDLSDGVNDESQLQRLMRQMAHAKFLFGLWSVLTDACQNIYHDPLSNDVQMLNLVGRPMALVNIGLNLELASPPMKTHSYADLQKSKEITLESYKFEVLVGDKSNLKDGLVGYFVSSTPSAPAPGESKRLDAATVKKPDSSCIFTEFGYPGRNIVDKKRHKPNTFASPQSSPIYVSPFHVDPSSHLDPAAYDRAVHNHESAVILGAIIDPFQPVHIATGVLPSTTLRLPQWVIDRTLKRLSLMLRGGPVLLRGDLPGADTCHPDVHNPPKSQAIPEAHIEPLTDKGEWSWLQPTVSDYAIGDEEAEELPAFVPYALKTGPAEYPLEMGPHTVLEGFYKYGLRESGA